MSDWTKLVVKFPIEQHHLLDAHVKALGTTISARARALLLADMAEAPLVPAIESKTEKVQLTEAQP
ncbi:MAG: hypothetical protein Q7R45_08260 [Sulfuricaulis sp.]|nr:hypothetical protein [Sulfuricaulis sp.]